MSASFNWGVVISSMSMISLTRPSSRFSLADDQLPTFTSANKSSCLCLQRLIKSWAQLRSRLSRLALNFSKTAMSVERNAGVSDVSGLTFVASALRRCSICTYIYATLL